MKPWKAPEPEHMELYGDYYERTTKSLEVWVNENLYQPSRSTTRTECLERELSEVRELAGIVIDETDTRVTISDAARAALEYLRGAITEPVEVASKQDYGEPWSIEYESLSAMICDRNGNEIVFLRGTLEVPTSVMGKRDLDHIVACVNACAEKNRGTS